MVTQINGNPYQQPSALNNAIQPGIAQDKGQTVEKDNQATSPQGSAAAQSQQTNTRNDEGARTVQASSDRAYDSGAAAIRQDRGTELDITV